MPCASLEYTIKIRADSVGKDEVVALPGEHQPADSIDVNFGITILGYDPDGNYEGEADMNCRGGAAGFRLIESETPSTSNTSKWGVVIDGFNIRNCSAVKGGGIYALLILVNSALTIKNTVVQDCSATEMGGGIYINTDVTSTVSISNVKLLMNTAKMGGGLYIHNSVTAGALHSMENLDIQGNRATLNHGGGMSLTSSSDVLSFIQFQIVNSIIHNNTATSNVVETTSLIRGGGGAYIQGVHAAMYNVSFRENSATHSGGGLITCSCPDIIIIYVTIHIKPHTDTVLAIETFSNLNNWQVFSKPMVN